MHGKIIIIMEYTLLGKTDLMTSRIAFSTVATDELSKEESVTLLRNAYESGINLFEADCSQNQVLEILGYAFFGMRKEVFISCKSTAQDQLQLQSDLIKSLDALNSNYVDILTIHNDIFVPSNKSNDGLFNALRLTKADGNAKLLGFSTHNIQLAKEALLLGCYDVITLSYELSLIQNDETEAAFFKDFINSDKALILRCAKENNIKVNVPILFGHLHTFENVIQLWPLKTNEDLQQILYFEKKPPEIDEKFLEELNKERNTAESKL